MWDQEKEHLRLFSNLIVERRARPTALLPIWNVAGYVLGIYIYYYQSNLCHVRLTDVFI